MKTNMLDGVSVVIITFNGRNRIEPTLKYLANQKETNFHWEVLIIDNNSTDNTKQVAHDLWNILNTKIPLRILLEEKQGQMHARKKGFIESKFKYMLFCDDDNWLSPYYLKTAYKIITNSSQIAAVGGLGIIEYEKRFNVPNWMSETYERSYGTGSQGQEDGDVTKSKGSLYTAGTIFSKTWLNKLYAMGFEPSLKGRDGHSLMGGEDTEITMALTSIGGELHYSSQMYFKHFMPKERISWTYLKKLWNSFGASNYIMSPYKMYGTSNFNYPYYKYIFRTITELLKLNYEKLFKQLKKGDVQLLRIEMEKGKLRALVFEQRKFKYCKYMVEKLKSNSLT